MKSINPDDFKVIDKLSPVFLRTHLMEIAMKKRKED
jgi:hypothetical protein